MSRWLLILPSPLRSLRRESFFSRRRWLDSISINVFNVIDRHAVDVVCLGLSIFVCVMSLLMTVIAFDYLQIFLAFRRFVSRFTFVWATRSIRFLILTRLRRSFIIIKLVLFLISFVPFLIRIRVDTVCAPSIMWWACVDSLIRILQTSSLSDKIFSRRGYLSRANNVVLKFRKKSRYQRRNSLNFVRRRQLCLKAEKIDLKLSYWLRWSLPRIRIDHVYLQLSIDWILYFVKQKRDEVISAFYLDRILFSFVMSLFLKISR